MKKTFLAILASQICFGAIAKNIECVALKKDVNIELGLKRTENFSNCFTLEELPSNTPVNFLVFSNDNVRNNIKLYQMNSSGSSTYLAEYSSEASGANVFATNTTNRDIAFKLTPLSEIRSDKNISISYLLANGTGHIIIDLDDIPSTYVAPTLDVDTGEL